MTLSHSALAASGLSVEEGLRAVTVIYVGGIRLGRPERVEVTL
jgi:hypothetical protein